MTTCSLLVVNCTSRISRSLMAETFSRASLLAALAGLPVMSRLVTSPPSPTPPPSPRDGICSALPYAPGRILPRQNHRLPPCPAPNRLRPSRHRRPQDHPAVEYPRTHAPSSRCSTPNRPYTG